MAAAVVLEHMVKRQWLKPYWRLWAFPAPSPDETGGAFSSAAVALSLLLCLTDGRNADVVCRDSSVLGDAS